MGSEMCIRDRGCKGFFNGVDCPGDGRSASRDWLGCVGMAGVAAALETVSRFALAGVPSKELRDGFLRLPGLTGFTADLRAGVRGLLGAAASSRKEVVRSASSSSPSLLVVLLFDRVASIVVSCGLVGGALANARWAGGASPVEAGVPFSTKRLYARALFKRLDSVLGERPYVLPGLSGVIVLCMKSGELGTS